MKPILFITLLVFTSLTQAQSSFNGTFCGEGEVNIQGQIRKGSKVLEVSVTDTELILKRDHTDFGDGSYMDGRPELATISEGNIIYNGNIIGTVSATLLQTNTLIFGYAIKYTITKLDSGFISFMRTSVNGDWYMVENFPTLKPCPL